MFTQRTQHLYTHDFCRHADRRAFSQHVRKQSDWHCLFEEVTQIFSSTCKINVLLYYLLEKSNLLMHYAQHWMRH